jgi:hypothetical protein
LFDYLIGVGEAIARILDHNHRDIINQ